MAADSAEVIACVLSLADRADTCPDEALAFAGAESCFWLRREAAVMSSSVPLTDGASHQPDTLKLVAQHCHYRLTRTRAESVAARPSVVVTRSTSV